MAAKREKSESVAVFDGLKKVRAPFGNNGRGSSVNVLTPIRNGRGVNLRPSDQITTEIKARGWTHAVASWMVDAEGQVRGLCLEPGSDGEGPRIRFDYEHLRPHIHIAGSGGITQSTVVEAEAHGDGFIFHLPRKEEPSHDL